MVGDNTLIGQIRPRMNVYGPDGRKLGTIRRVDAVTGGSERQGSHTPLQHGPCFFQVTGGVSSLAGGFWVPGNMIRGVRGDQVMVQYPRDELAAGAPRHCPDQLGRRTSGRLLRYPALLVKGGIRLLVRSAVLAITVISNPRRHKQIA